MRRTVPSTLNVYRPDEDSSLHQSIIHLKSELEKFKAQAEAYKRHAKAEIVEDLQSQLHELRIENETLQSHLSEAEQKSKVELSQFQEQIGDYLHEIQTNLDGSYEEKIKALEEKQIKTQQELEDALKRESRYKEQVNEYEEYVNEVTTLRQNQEANREELQRVQHMHEEVQHHYEQTLDSWNKEKQARIRAEEQLQTALESIDLLQVEKEEWTEERTSLLTTAQQHEQEHATIIAKIVALNETFSEQSPVEVDQCEPLPHLEEQVTGLLQQLQEQQKQLKESESILHYLEEQFNQFTEEMQQIKQILT
ncbi:hypothetical protein N781_16965 [Pontibacillus halophilus JSM 076056 = DSM 19796]|uniref:Uncharacterized protein n=1 Tax=Pontibacillus halophilus JSM 076056 = DSM 19796 TaxID=1385510 RepID=A0A0A5GMT5_9BACI|nr:hypothetical protein [Pontibacillus halophilus]KGX92513.1 hypothetical protein N781_16965 [Pontibacillus halophilus JSM 076056 = DSM 19796]